MTSVQYGNGEGYPSKNYKDGYYRKLEPMLLTFEGGKEFLEVINNGFSERIAHAEKLQNMYEQQRAESPFLEPTELVEELGRIIDQFAFEKPNFKQNGSAIFDKKQVVPKKQFMALYAISRISSVANKK